MKLTFMSDVFLSIFLFMFVIFIIMNYQKIHDSIIERAKFRIISGYTENHHIIPKCLGGNNRKENLVRLTAKEHWVIHQLLCLLNPKNYSLLKALECMTIRGNNQERNYVISGEQYQRIKKEAAILHSERMRGRKLKPFTEEHKKNIGLSKKGISSWSKGKKFTEEHKKNIGLSSKGRIDGDKNPMRNPDVLKKHTSLFSDKKNPNKTKKKCEFCGIFVGLGNFKRWHGDKCKKKMTKRYVFISDTHGKHEYLTSKRMGNILGSGDCLIHSGDISNVGKTYEIKDFLDWFSNTDFTHKIFIAGNHDFGFELNHDIVQEYKDKGVIYLFDSEVVIDGVKFYGSPWQPEFYDWAFNLPRGQKLAEKWRKIPDDTDILITHGPAHGMLDWTPSGQVVGCEDLFHRIMEVQPKIHVCGHIHCAYGQKNFNGVEFLNASVLNERYEYENKPIKLEFDVNDKLIVDYYD